MGGGKGKQKKEVVVALVVKKLFDGIFFRLRIISSKKKIGKVVVNIKKQQKKSCLQLKGSCIENFLVMIA